MMVILLIRLILAAAQAEELSLAEAVRVAQRQHPSVKAADARLNAAAYQREQAQSGFLPKVNYMESYQRSNNPVFVFSSLLAQRRFTERNFAIDTLNNPASVNNFQSVLSAEQTLFDAGVTKRSIESADLRKQLSAEEKRQLEMNLAAGAARAYLGVLLTEEGLRVAREAVKSAEADLDRARSIRQAGLSTDADVLSIEVHLAAMKEQEVRRKADLDVAHAALNEVMGVPLDAEHRLTTTLGQLAAGPGERQAYETKAATERAEARQALLGVQLAEKQSAQARAAYFPRVSVRGVLEADRGRFVTQAGGNWFAGVTLQWNLFNGFADRGRIRESQQMIASTRSQADQVRNGAKLEVRRAHVDLVAATERIGLSAAAVAQAEESLRITRNRYEGGLSTVTDLLRNQVAVLESRLRQLMAVHDQRVAAVMLELAAGGLTPESEVLR
jgi:outer membrane protein